MVYPKCISSIQKEPQLRILDQDMLASNKFENFFDLIILSNVLEHMIDPGRRIKEFSRLFSITYFSFSAFVFSDNWVVIFSGIFLTLFEGKIAAPLFEISPLYILSKLSS